MRKYNIQTYITASFTLYTFFNRKLAFFNHLFQLTRVFFDLKHMGKLKEMIEKGQLSIEEGVKSEGSGNVRLDVILSQDNKFAAVQLFQFVPYTYTPVTSVHYYTGNDAATISAFLAKCKVN